MEKEDRETIRHISETLDEVHAVLSKPPKKIRVVMEFVVAGVTILGVVSIIEIITHWIRG